MPASLTATQVDDIERLVLDFQASQSGAPTHARQAANVSILGGRGLGKSTLLAAATSRIASESRLVLPTVDPELFHAADSLMSWALTGIETLLTPSELNDSLGGDVTIKKMLHDLRRDYVLVSGDLSTSLVRRGVSPAEYARDASTLTPIGMRISSSWSDLLDAIAEKRQEPDLMVILPVDDVDLHPVRISDLLSQLQALGSSRRFLCILAADEATLLNCMVFGDSAEADQWDRAVRHGFASGRDLADLADKKFAKHFPRQFRIRLDEVIADQRLNFAPAEAPGKTLGDLLARFPLKHEAPRTLRDLFEVRSSDGEHVGGSGYVEALSGNRRDLQQLCSALAALPASETGAKSALATILQHGTESSRTSLPPVVRDAIRILPGSDGLQLAMNLTHIDFGVTVGAGPLVYRPPAQQTSEDDPRITVWLRKVAGFYANVQSAVPDEISDPDGSATDDAEASSNMLPSMFNALVFLAWEAKELEDAEGRSLLPLTTFMGRMGTPGLSNWNGTISTRNSTPTPYLMVPDWEEYSDYFSYIFAWNRLVDAVAQAVRQQPDRVAILEFCIISHLRLVVQIQRERTVPSDLVDLQPEDLPASDGADDWDVRFEAYLSQLRTDLLNTLSVALSDAGNDTRSSDFVRWAAMGPALATTRNICSNRLAEELRTLWMELSLSAEERQTIARFLSREVAKYVTDDRAEADIELLEFVEPGRGSTMANVRLAIGERLYAARQTAVSSLVANGVDAELITTLQDAGATVETLTALSASGMNATSLSRIAELFPPSGHDTSGDLATPHA